MPTPPPSLPLIEPSLSLGSSCDTERISCPFTNPNPTRPQIDTPPSSLSLYLPPPPPLCTPYHFILILLNPITTSFLLIFFSFFFRKTHCSGVTRKTTSLSSWPKESAILESADCITSSALLGRRNCTPGDEIKPQLQTSGLHKSTGSSRRASDVPL